MGKRRNETGNVYGRLTVIAEAGRDCHGNALHLCRCSCGVKRTVNGFNLRSGNTQSCGCLNRELSAKRMTDLGRNSGIHGHCRNGKPSPEYRCWQDLKDRCTNPNNACYSNYGGRGITVCPEWLESFEAFYRDMGPRPSPDLSLDRIDNDGNYEPGNCRWATRKQQNKNRRRKVAA